ncbi:MAG TPA: ATP synthase F1 subunit delta [Candidatus Acidoferrales bacterium]|nr:ATP synthase F1 subunit delta [Candidatus Acidoferrales bacterium]
MAAVAGRYARAFAEVAAEHKMDPDKTIQELEQVSALFDQSHELHNVFLNPAVPHQQKIGLLDAIMQKTGGTRWLRNFLAVLIEHRRIGQIAEIAREFREQLDQRMGIADAQVNSARELTASEKKTLETQLAGVTGKKIRASYAEDPALLGGAVVRIGSTIYDGSVRGQLERIKEQIVGA